MYSPVSNVDRDGSIDDSDVTTLPAGASPTESYNGNAGGMDINGSDGNISCSLT